MRKYCIKFEKRINELYRTLVLEEYNWGLSADVYDKRVNDINYKYSHRNFNFTPKYPTKEANIQRALSYFKMENAQQVNP